MSPQGHTQQQQGTGSGSKLESYIVGAHNADVVASTLSSVHMHLRARYFVVTSKYVDHEDRGHGACERLRNGDICH